MILFFSGVFATIGLGAMLGAGYILGQRKSPKSNVKPVDEVEQEENRRKQLAIAKDFNNLMSYNEDIAYMRKKVN